MRQAAGINPAGHGMAMKGFLNPYASTRDGSGTSWVPDATPHELTEGIPGLEGRVFTVGKISAGGIHDFIRTDRAKFGIGGLASRYVLPSDLKAEYGRDLTSFMVFGRLKPLWPDEARPISQLPPIGRS